MPAPELENEDPKPNQPVTPKEEEGKAQRVVSWQDGVDGKSLFTVRRQAVIASLGMVHAQTPFLSGLTMILQVREFEPSETALSDDEDNRLDKPRICCSVM